MPRDFQVQPALSFPRALVVAGLGLLVMLVDRPAATLDVRVRLTEPRLEAIPTRTAPLAYPAVSASSAPTRASAATRDAPAKTSGASRTGPQARPGIGFADLGQRFGTAVDKRALFEELRDGGSAEGFYFAAEILRDCLDVAEHGFASVVDSFFANISLDSPHAASQVSAFRELVEPCAGFDGRQGTPAEIELMLNAGAHRGEPRAIAQMLASPRIATRSDSPKLAQELLALNDPYVMTGVSNYLAGPHAQGFVIDGKALDASESASVAMAWALVACDYGAPCGAGSRAVLRACAQGGMCEVRSVDELLRMTNIDDDAYRRAQHYRERIVLALQRRDYASIGLDASRL